MKRFTIILAISLCFLMSPIYPKAVDAPKILLIMPNVVNSENIDNVLNKEVGVMKGMLEKANFKVVAATIDGLPIKGSTETFTPDLKLSDVKIDSYSGVLIACMASGESTPVFPEAVLMVKQAITQGKPVAASHSSVNVLVEAGVLAGKRYAYRFDAQIRYSSFAGAIYGGTGVVQEGNIITCGICPAAQVSYGINDCTTELIQAFITVLSPKK